MELLSEILVGLLVGGGIGLPVLLPAVQKFLRETKLDGNGQVPVTNNQSGSSEREQILAEASTWLGR